MVDLDADKGYLGALDYPSINKFLSNIRLVNLRHTSVEEHCEKLSSRITSISDWKRDRTLCQCYDLVRSWKRRYPSKQFRHLGKEYVEEDAVILLGYRNNSGLASQQGYAQSSEEEKEAAETVYHFLLDHGPHKIYDAAYLEAFKKITSIANWRNNKLLTVLYKRLRNQKRKFLCLRYIDEDRILLPDDNSFPSHPDASMGLSNEEMDIIEDVYNFLADWGAHRIYEKAYKDMLEKIIFCYNWRKKPSLANAYKSLRRDMRRNAHLIMQEIEIQKGFEEESLDGFEVNERETADLIVKFLRTANFLRYGESYAWRINKLTSLPNWQQKTNLVRLLRNLRDEKRRQKWYQLRCLNLRHVEEDIYVLPYPSIIPANLPKPRYTGLSEGEIKAAQQAYNFLTHWGPHRTYQKAYDKVFASIMSCDNWQTNTQLVGLFLALQDERRRQAVYEPEALSLQGQQIEQLRILDQKIADDEEPNFQRLCAREHEIEEILEYFEEGWYETELETDQDCKRMLQRIKSVLGWESHPTLMSCFAKLRLFQKRLLDSARIKIICLEGPEPTIEDYHNSYSRSESTEVGELDISFSEEKASSLAGHEIADTRSSSLFKQKQE